MILRYFLLTFVLASPLTAQENQVYTGITQPFADVTLSVPVTGIISKQYFVEGDAVSQGDIIMTLDTQREELEVLRQETILESLTKELKRTEKLFQITKAVSREELDQKVAALKVAETDLALAQEDLRRRQLVAPFDGILADLFDTSEGEGVELQAPLARLVDTRHCLFVCNLPGQALDGVRKGDPVEVTVEEIACAGKVTFISPVMDPSSGLVELKAVFENPDVRLRPGAAGYLRFPTP